MWPDTTSKIAFKNDNKEFENSGLTYVINPYDEFCLTRALMLKESNGGTVTVLHVGRCNYRTYYKKSISYWS